MKKTVIGISLAAASCAAWSIYKCPTANGGAAYQDAPCPDGQAIKARPNGATTSDAPPATSWKSRNEQKRIDDEFDPAKISPARIQVGMANHYPVVGMTLYQLDVAMGRPATIRSEFKSNNQYDVYLYRLKDKMYDVYVRNGMVESIIAETR
jgi:hypothetical protein